jgi:hypothetical protein
MKNAFLFSRASKQSLILPPRLNSNSLAPLRQRTVPLSPKEMSQGFCPLAHRLFFPGSKAAYKPFHEGHDHLGYKSDQDNDRKQPETEAYDHLDGPKHRQRSDRCAEELTCFLAPDKYTHQDPYENNASQHNAFSFPGFSGLKKDSYHDLVPQ